MSKGSGGVNNIKGITLPTIRKYGDGDSEFDGFRDYYVTSDVAERFDTYDKEMVTYDAFEKYLNSKNIELDVDIESLKNSKRFDVKEKPSELYKKLAVAIDTYESYFGKSSLSGLKKIKLHDNDSDTPASFNYNEIGENDPDAGTMFFRDWGASGREIFHELAHVLQYSKSGSKGLLKWSSDIIQGSNLSKSHAYMGVDSKVRDAESFAEAFAKGFSNGNKEGLDFIKYVAKTIK